MPNISPNSITNFSQDWAHDPNSGLPFSGEAVQAFIKSHLRSSAGAASFNAATSTLYFFHNSDDRQTWEADNTRTDLILSSTVLNFSSELSRIYLTNNVGSFEINAATNQTTLPLSIDFDVQTKSISDAYWTSTGKGALVRAYLDSGAVGAYTEIPNVSRVLLAGETFELDVRSYIPIGSSRVKIVFQSEDDENITASFTYTINLSQMYIEMMDNTWYNAIIEGEASDYKLGGFKIVGSAYKTLVIEIYQGSSMVGSFESIIGNSTYTDVAYNFTADEGLDLSSLHLGTGIYICKAYLTAGSLTSLPVTYNFMYVAATDKQTAKLICVNDVASRVYNYSTSVLCNYALYNSGFSVGSPHVLIQFVSGTTPTTKVDTDYEDITTGVKHALEYTVEWLTEQTINLSVYTNISLGTSAQTFSIPIDNSSTYPAELGAAFYLNATTRSNNDANRTSILNEASTPAEEIEATWERMAWVDGIDGWTTDAEGRRALVVTAGSTCTIPYQVMTGEDITFELNYRVANVSDYDENVITIATNPTAPGFHGIRIRPTGFTVHSNADISAANDTTRGKSVGDEETVHLLITIQRSFGAYTGKNLVTAYVNGCKSLQFPYESGTVWENNANFIIGSTTSDVYIYSCRVYRKVLGVKAAQQNYINSLRTLEDRAIASAWFESAINTSTNEISYEKVVNSSNNYNFFVIEMKDGMTVPSLANDWDKETSGFSDIEMHYGEHPDWDWKLFNVQTSGQGTTSMNYYRWNIRWRIDKTNDSKKVPVAYYDEPTYGLDGKKIFRQLAPTDSKTVHFDGEGNHPAVMRITAKINQASSMQSHKIGATRSYTVLHEALNLENEAQAFARANELPVPTVAVYQYPAFGFVRHVSMGVETYEFIGLFTIGPDKGDKPTFGYNIADSIKNNLITLEGTNHSRKMAVFQYPWNSEVEYRASNECLNIVTGNNSFDNAWEVSNCHGLDTDKAVAQADVQSVLEAEFKPAYDVVWENSTLIFPIALNDATYGGANAAAVLANINADAENFRGAQYNSRFSNSDLEFWIEGEYVLYHYDLVSGQYVSGINLVTQNGNPSGSTLDEKNEWFKAQRRARFLTDAPEYWDIQDAAYHLAFCIVFGATDNFAKNTYPYKMAPINMSGGHNIGGKWKWRQDDLDTIFDIDNLGTDSKPYYIEYADAEGGSTVFGGANSAFWTLMYEVFWDDYGVNKGVESIGADMVTAMATLGGGANPFAGVVNFFKKYFWDYAQNYFPQSAYNADANFKYEQGWLSGIQASALTQSLGRHLEAERLWCTRRAIYVMSLFKVGPFKSYADQTLGRITFRPSSLVNPTVTPMMWMYPAAFFGEGSPEATSRTEAGEDYVFNRTYGAGGQNNFYYKATDYLESLGDWKDLVLANGYIAAIDVVGAKLREFKIGEPNIYYTQEEIDAAQEGDPAYGMTTDDIKTAASVTTNVPSLTFNNTKCLEEIDARNASSLTGSLDLSACTRLVRAYFEGTSLTQILLANGVKIETLHYPDTVNSITLRNLKCLTDLVLPSNVGIIQTLRVENCSTPNPFTLMKTCYNAENSVLQFIRIIWEGGTIDAEGIHMLANIASDLDKDDQPVTHAGFRGLDAEGNVTDHPRIEGSITMTTGMYSSDLESLQVTLEEDWGEGYRRALSSLFGTLYVIYDPTRLYIHFADDTVKTLCINAGWTADTFGMTAGEAAAVTSFGQVFNQKAITSFDEFRYFTGITSIAGGANASVRNFDSCTSLKSITFPTSVTTVGSYAFTACSSLEEITLTRENGISLGVGSFDGCTKVAKINIPSIASWMRNGYSGSGTRTLTYAATNGASLYVNGSKITDLIIPSSFSSIGAVTFYRIKGFGTVTFHSGITSIGDEAFRGSGLTSVTVPSTITSIGSGAFNDCTSLNTLVIKNTSITINVNVIQNCSRSGILKVYGNLTRTANIAAVYFKDIIVGGNYTNTFDYGLSNRPEIVSIRIGGDYSSTKGWLIHTYSNGNSKLEFLEIMGDCSATAVIYANGSAPTSCAVGCIIHFGYNHKVTATPNQVMSSNANTRNRIAKIYVGPGESQAGDEAVLAEYLADTDWSAYSSKLTTWWNYKNDPNANQDYITPISDILV